MAIHGQQRAMAARLTPAPYQHARSLPRRVQGARCYLPWKISKPKEVGGLGKHKHSHEAQLKRNGPRPRGRPFPITTIIGNAPTDYRADGKQQVSHSRFPFPFDSPDCYPFSSYQESIIFVINLFQVNAWALALGHALASRYRIHGAQWNGVGFLVGSG